MTPSAPVRPSAFLPRRNPDVFRLVRSPRYHVYFFFLFAGLAAATYVPGFRDWLGLSPVHVLVPAALFAVLSLVSAAVRSATSPAATLYSSLEYAQSVGLSAIGAYWVIATGRLESLPWLLVLGNACGVATLYETHLPTAAAVFFSAAAPGAIMLATGSVSGMVPLFFTFFISATCLIVYLVFARITDSTLALQRERALLAVQLRQIEMLREKDRIARDLHDTLGGTLAQIALLSDSSSQPAARRRIGDAAREGLSELRALVWALDPENDRLGELAGRLRTVAEETALAGSLQLDLDLPHAGEETPVSGRARLSATRVCQEATANVLKHARASTLKVSMRAEGGWLTLTIEDDGVGLPTGNSNGGRGLHNMRARTEALGGETRIEAGAEGGVRVAVRVPLSEGRN